MYRQNIAVRIWKYTFGCESMHEMALAQGILDVALSNASQHGAVKIGRIKLLVGEMTHVEPESLRFCFTALSAGSIAESAVVDIEVTPLRGRCRECNREFSVAGYCFICPECRSSSVEIISGRELTVEHLEVE